MEGTVLIARRFVVVKVDKGLVGTILQDKGTEYFVCEVFFQRTRQA